MRSLWILGLACGITGLGPFSVAAEHLPNAQRDDQHRSTSVPIETVRLKESRLGFISYNILEGFSNAANGRFPAGRARQKIVAKWLADQAPSMVGFQELNGYTVERLQAEAQTWGHSFRLIDLYAKHRAEVKNGDLRRIDYILASPGLAAGSMEATWHVGDPYQQMSDHYPVSAELIWATEARGQREPIVSGNQLPTFIVAGQSNAFRLGRVSVSSQPLSRRIEGIFALASMA